MSLVRLLTAGKSLTGLRDPETRYRLSRPGSLPRFGAKQNPFRATTKPEVAQSAASAPDTTRSETTAPEAVIADLSGEPAVGALASGAATCAGGSAASEPLAPQVPEPGRLSPVGRCAAKLKSLLTFRRRPAPGFATRPLGKPMVQAELSLERVRVVRNDLSDSDLEIVAVKAKAGRPAEQPADSSWEKAAGRLFEAGKL